jgi:DNA ligase-1
VVEGAGKLLGMLGALNCRTKAGVEFQIGSGFSEEDRRQIWGMKNLPRLVNYKFQELTLDGVPRFPVFRGFRHEDDA